VAAGEPAPTEGAPGAGGGAGTHFDGDDDQLALAPLAGFSPGDDGFSVVFWVRHADLPVSDDVADEDWAWGVHSETGDARIGLDPREASNGQLAFWLSDFDGACRGTTFHAGAAVDDGVWHHVVFVLRGRETLRSYVDGELTAAGSTDGPCELAGDVWTLGVGAHATAGATGRWAGDLDDLVVVNRPLSTREVAALYACDGEWAADVTSEAWPRSLDAERPARARPDLADLRLTVHPETCPEMDVPFEVFGARPLGGKSTLDHEVRGYWPFDGEVTELREPAAARLEGPGDWVRGRFGEPSGALSLDGTGYVTEGDQARLLDAAGLTLEAWVRWAGGGDGIEWVAGQWGADGQRSYGLSLSADGRARCSVSTDGDNLLVVQASEPVFVGTWAHLACSWDLETLRVYVAGVDRSNDSVVTGGPVQGPVAGSNAELRIGSADHAGAGSLRGELDDVVLHGVARSADYLYKRAYPIPTLRFFVGTSVVASGADGFAYHPFTLHLAEGGDLPAGWRPPKGLLSEAMGYVGWWRFDEETGDLALDESANRNHGRMIDGTWRPPPEGPSGIDTRGGAPISVPASPSLGRTEAVTVEVVAETAGEAAQVVLWKGADEAVGGFSLETGAMTALRLLRLDDLQRARAERIRLGSLWPEGAFASLAVTAAPGEAFEPLRGLYAYADGDLRCSGLCPKRLAADESMASDTYLFLFADPRPSASFEARVRQVRLMNRPLSRAELLPEERTRVGWAALQVPPPEERPEDVDGDSIPDATECAAFLDPADGDKPPVRLFDGFEDGDTLADRGAVWQPPDAGCFTFAEKPRRSGRRSLRIDAATPGCEGVRTLETVAGALGAPDDFAVVTWFYDDPKGDGPLTLALVDDNGDATTLGFDAAFDATRYTLSSSGSPPPARRQPRSEGWHLAAMFRVAGRTYAYIDGNWLGSVPSLGQPSTLRLRAERREAWFDDLLVYGGGALPGPGGD